jgi:16S rRNA (cytosine967-C5)-methyltransferase
MTRWENYLVTAEKIVSTYDGTVPLHHFLKGFFKQHPYMGSRDRRWISQIVYHYYRIGQLRKEESVAERMILANFLCSSATNEFLQAVRPGQEKPVIEEIGDKIFPFDIAFSDGLKKAGYGQSFLEQPNLFIRTRNNKQQAIIRLLEKAAIEFETIGANTISLPNGTKIDTLITDKSWYEIQDASSQKVGELFHPKAGETWWDCCAASGGKSILLLDKQPGVKLLVSDIRASIIQNLHQRFKEAGIRNYESIVLDLSTPVTSSSISSRQFDNIILDAPCSGSGTWGRTPENMFYFSEEKVNHYQQLQKQISANVVSLLKPGGSLIYITCSAFRKENEEVVEMLENEYGLVKQEGGIIHESHADIMFAVRLTK